MKDKKQLIFRILLISLPILVGILAFSIIYGWYVRVIRTGKIDGSTKNVSITYVFNDGRHTTTNSLTYTIDNLTFFDIDNTDETSYFDEMMCDLEIKLINTSNSAMTYSINFKAEKRIVTDSNEDVISISYVAGYFTKSPTTTISALKTNGTVSSNTITYTETDNPSSFNVLCQSPEDQLEGSNETTSDEATVHIYLIGVQEIDSAKNTDFLYSESDVDGVRVRVPIEYTFTITIVGVPKSNNQETEITTTAE